MGEFVQLPVPLTLAADVINVTFSRSLWPEKLNAEHLKKKKKKAHWQSFLFTVGDSLKQVALPFSCVSSLLEGILAFWQNMMFQTHPDFSCPKTWNQVSPGFFSSNSRE